MSEPESLATREGLDAHIRRHSYDRLLMLSDGIFAIAITLAALEIRLPEHIATEHDLWHIVMRPLLGYLVSFVVVAVFWISHRNLFARLRRVDNVITGLTLAMLCMIAFVPAVIHGVVTPHSEQWAFRLYAGTMMVCGLINAALWLYAAWRKGLMASEMTPKDRWTRAVMSMAMPLIFLTFFFASPEQVPIYLLPFAAVMIVLRRVVVPRIVKGKLR